MNEFTAQIDAFAKLADRSVSDTAVAVVTNLFASVILDTPVGNPTLWQDQNAAQKAVEDGYTGGRARANWQFTIQTDATGLIDMDGPQGVAKSEALAASLPSLVQPGEVHYLTNNLPYAEALEHGHSGQAPAGMVRKNMVRISGVLDGIVRSNAL